MITNDSKTILLADDSVFFRTKLSAILSEAGHRVRFASDGRDVIREIQIDPRGIDLLVLDLQMPNVDGFGVLEWMRDNGCGGNMPVLVITGIYEPGDVVARLKGLGAKGLLSKGFSPEQVVYRVNTLLFPEKKLDRKEDRVPVSVPVDFMVGEKTYTGFLLNISIGGVFLHTRVELLPGTLMSLKFSLRGIERVINARGIVRWVTPPSAANNLFRGAGVKFNEISAEDLYAVRKFIDNEMTKLAWQEHKG
ncbi:MAG: response regulator [Deltaproteobacteria bacterium]|nr:response regulator [Deltaproteobacteria bacterium]